MQLIQHALDGLSARTYLEIGVDEGQTFSVVRAPIKIGVDPIDPRPAVKVELERPGSTYFAATSDEFFSQHAPHVLSAGADVVFIDGLHTYHQTYRDVQNALRILNPGGVILVHDCLPTSAAEARVAPTYEEAWRLNGPDWSGLWTSDGWKAIVAVRAGHQPGHACVLNCDHGVGVVYRGEGPAPLDLPLSRIEELDYDALAAAPERLLGLCRPVRFKTLVDTLRQQRRSH